jgi:hypothetical protein
MTYDLEHINAERQRQGHRKLTPEEAERAAKRAHDDGSGDITSALILATVVTLTSSESPASPSFSSHGGDFSGGGASSDGDGGGGGE